jgi:hypothetical protein
LEGDDYWNSPEKLQKQVDFLDSHPDFVICSHWVDRLEQESGKIHYKFYGPPVAKPYYTDDDILEHGPFCLACSWLYRNHLLSEFPAWYADSISGDLVLLLLYGQHGKIGVLDEAMATYRFRREGAWSGNPSLTKRQQAIFVHKFIGKKLELHRRVSYRLGLSRKYMRLFNVCNTEGKTLRACLAFGNALWITPSDFRKQLVVNTFPFFEGILNRWQSFVQVLRIFRIKWLGIMKRLCGQKIYQKLKAKYHSLKKQNSNV